MTNLTELIQRGVTLAQQLNDHLTADPEISKWRDGAFILGTICLAGGVAKMAKMPHDDFISLCEAAYRGMDAVPKDPRPEPA